MADDSGFRPDAQALRAELEHLRSVPPMRSATFYITLIIGLSGLAVLAVLLVLALRPEDDNTPVIVGVFGFVGPMIAAVLAAMVRDVHTVINSRMDALLAATERAASAEGRAEGKAEPKG